MLWDRPNTLAEGPVMLEFRARVAYTLATTGFKKQELPKASEAYLAVEKATASKPGTQTVLVSLDSVHALRSAYPNYFLDTNAFVTALKFAIRPRQKLTNTADSQTATV